MLGVNSCTVANDACNTTFHCVLKYIVLSFFTESVTWLLTRSAFHP